MVEKYVPVIGRRHVWLKCPCGDGPRFFVVAVLEFTSTWYFRKEGINALSHVRPKLDTDMAKPLVAVQLENAKSRRGHEVMRYLPSAQRSGHGTSC